ncbi:hypothetical protein [Photobacterium sp. GB-210]|uniref:NfrA family protein n=1 Tax=Photobacterium sp. GB-210 TaxID=2022104 RepID=UPI000D1733F9|nr:hypothetical protein [Photobacterium sp. GB-210]PSV37281.1 hypothetical protein C9J38_10965 [Photobacterium sp. GB-210]
MNYIEKALIASVCTLLSIRVDADDNIYTNLSDLEHFRTYPYVDKAFKMQNNQQYNAALEELNNALAIVPAHIPFLKFGYQLAVKADQPINIQLKYLTKIPQGKRGDDILNVWLDDANNGKIYTDTQLQRIASTLTSKQMKKFFIYNVYKLLKKYNAETAVEWSYSKPNKYKSLATLHFEAYNLFAIKKHEKAQPLLEKLYESSHSNQTYLKYLALNTLANGNETQALKYAEKIILDSSYKDFYNQYIEYLLSTYQYRKAKIELNKLHDNNALPESFAKQHDYLNLLNQQTLKEFSVMSDCLKKTVTKISTNKAELARFQFKHCKPETDSVMWIKLASELNLYTQIENTQFNTASAKKLKKEVLLTHYKQQQKWLKIINELKDDGYKSPSLSRDLAYAYSQVNQYNKSAQIFFINYKNNHQNSDLSHAIFNALQSPNGDEIAASMVNYGLKKQKGKLLADPMFVKNILNITQRNVRLFSPQSIAAANRKIVTLSPKVWGMQHQCHLIEGLSTNDDFLKQAIAYCVADKDPLKAAKHYQSSLKQQPTKEQALLLAEWFAKANEYQASSTYWLKAVRNSTDLKGLTPYSRYLFIHTLNKVGQPTLANQSWVESDFDKKNVQWWELGIDIAKKLEDQEIFIARIEQGVDHTESSVLTQYLAEHIVKTNDSRLANKLFENDKTGNASALLGYQIYKKDPQLALRAFESAYRYPKHKKNVDMISQYADLEYKNGNLSNAQQLYKSAIDQVLEQKEANPKLLAYLQSSHKNIDLGWKYNVSGWVGTDQQNAIPGLTNSTGNYFLYEEAKYYFEKPWLPRSAFSIAALSNGGFENKLSDNITDIDLSYQIQPFAKHNSYLKAGVRQRVIGKDRKTRPYLRISSNVLSNDKWSKDWKPEPDQWLYQSLYADGLIYVDNLHDYILFARYEIGNTFKIKEKYQQRLTPYTFVQWSDDSEDISTVVGLGVSWNFKLFNTKYNGLNLDSEVGLEWQHTVESSQRNKSDDAALVRYSFSF